MDIAINKEFIFKEVSMYISIIARDLKDANGVSLYDRVRLQERDYAFLEANLPLGVAATADAIRDFVTASGSDSITVVPDKRSRSGMLPEVQSLFNQCIVSWLASEWVKLKAVEYAVVFTEKTAEAVRQLRRKLYYKLEPVFRLYGEEEEE